MPESESPNSISVSPLIFGGGHRQRCLNKGACEQVFIIDRLEDGDIYACPACLGKHEFYVAYAPGPQAGTRIKYGRVRLLQGEHIRTPGEPRIDEWVK